MKKYLLLLLAPVLVIISCVSDQSAYEPQPKEDVEVDDFEPGSSGGEETPPPGTIIPGVHQVKLEIVDSEGVTVERVFKYFMPASLDSSEPISLVFNFHNTVEFEKNQIPGDPIASVSSSSALNQTAIKNNWVVCYPRSLPTYFDEGNGELNWSEIEQELAFFDATLEYFAQCTPTIDASRVYAVGYGSGAGFCYELALSRSESITAIAPLQCTYEVPDDATVPARGVPLMQFMNNPPADPGTTQLTKVAKWAERIGGYFPSDVTETINAFELSGYTQVNSYVWSGGDAEIAAYVLVSETGTPNMTQIMPRIGDFFKSNSLGQLNPVFVSLETDEIILSESQRIEISIKYTKGADVQLVDAPASWTPVLENDKLTLTAPSDFYGNVSRKGTFSIRATLDGRTGSAEISYELLEPKAFFEVGDVYYNLSAQPAGVVCWVNPANIREAKIISLTGPGAAGSMPYGAGLGNDFDTPSTSDGAANTAAMVAKNTELGEPLDAATAAFMWAYGYSAEGLTGWYLPAIDELADISGNVAIIEAALKTLGVSQTFSKLSLHCSTTESNGATKKFYKYNFSSKRVLFDEVADEQIPAAYVRAFRQVTK